MILYVPMDNIMLILYIYNDVYKLNVTNIHAVFNQCQRDKHN